ncbi:hypothetical protein Tco_1145922, partial [Tanacetum coccineum]
VIDMSFESLELNSYNLDNLPYRRKYKTDPRCQFRNHGNGPDIQNMTLNEYLEYEAEKERQSWRNVQSKSSPTRYEGANFNSSHCVKSITLDFPHYYEDAFTKPKENPLSDHSCGLTPWFFAQPPHTPNTPVDKKDSSLDKILDDLFKIGAKTLRQMGQEIQNRCDDDISRDANHESDGDDGNTYDIWDIMGEDVERFGQFLMPNIPVVMDDVIQPLILKTIHAMLPDEDYVAPATNSILDELLEEFEDEILNVTMVDKEADFNPTHDMEELERLLTKDPQSHFTEIQVDREMKSPSSFIGKCTWSYASCKKASQTRLVGCYIGDEEVACNGRCYSRKQTWSMD